MMAIPTEIYKADYFSRIRILDVYPYEWSKYHMFNGVSSAIPLAVFPLKNILTYGLARYSFISFLIGAIYEQLKLKTNSRKKAILYFIVGASLFCVCGFDLLKWSLFMNNYSGLLLFGILWFVMVRKDYKKASIVSLMLSFATSKSAITGIVLFVFCMVKGYKDEITNTSLKNVCRKNISQIIYFFFGIVTVCVMFLSGKSPIGETIFQPRLIYNMVLSGWSNSLPLFKSLDNITKLNQCPLNIKLELIILLLYLMLLFIKRNKLIVHIKANFKKYFFIGMLLAATYVAYWIYINNNNLIIRLSIFRIPAIIICVFILPIACVFVSCEKHMIEPLMYYVLFAIIQYMLLIPDNGMCNFSMIMIPVLYYIVDVNFEFFNGLKKYSSVQTYGIIGLIFMLALVNIRTDEPYYIYVLSRNDGFQKVVQLEQVEYLDNKAYIYDGDVTEEDIVRLNALKGNRISYKNSVTTYEHTTELTISQRFITEQ